MAEQHGMIEPFEPNQVKQNAKGERMVSYGTSSYGYDIRCSTEFKLFTNINSTIVDPKNFDPNSFVEVNGLLPRFELIVDEYVRPPYKT
jgi:dCTP deaminase